MEPSDPGPAFRPEAGLRVAPVAPYPNTRRSAVARVRAHATTVGPDGLECRSGEACPSLMGSEGTRDTRHEPLDPDLVYREGGAVPFEPTAVAVSGSRCRESGFMLGERGASTPFGVLQERNRRLVPRLFTIP